MIEIKSRNVPGLYVESYWAMKLNGVEENSRNGKVLTIPEPTVVTLRSPLQRVLFDPERDANPFFHVMETIWMLAGDNHVGFPSKFNRTYVNYAEADGIVHGAYGKRWRDHFHPTEIGPRFLMDQIQVACALLRKDPESRQVVLSMWDPAEDLGASVKDRPCNTHIYFRARAEDNHDLFTLDMTVCNRSNDLLWGCLGANVVHMTYLHELVAYGANMEVGIYRVFSNNLHVYKDRPDVTKFMGGPIRMDPYKRRAVDYYPLIQEPEKVEELFEDCEAFVKLGLGYTDYKTVWIKTVAVPMLQAWEARVDKRFDDSYMFIDRIKATDWRLACKQWTERKILSYAT